MTGRQRVYECATMLRTERDALQVIADAWARRATLVVVPVDRLDDDFFRLSTRSAGEILQKFVTYRLRIAIVGDISSHTADSRALRDFVHEANQGRDIWFLDSLEDLEARLAAQPTA